jgi:hypothetical protein
MIFPDSGVTHPTTPVPAALFRQPKPLPAIENDKLDRDRRHRPSLPDMMHVMVIKRRRNWEWRIHDQAGRLMMRGRERTRPAARYQGYRNLFMLLAIGRNPTDPQAARKFSKGDAPAVTPPEATKQRSVQRRQST